MAVVTSHYREGKYNAAPATWNALDDLIVVLIGDPSWSFDVDDVTLLDMSIGAVELVADGYDRQPLTVGAPAWVSPRWTRPSAANVWPDLGTDEPVYAVIVAQEVGVGDANVVPWAAVYDDGGAALWTCDGTTASYAVDLGTT